MRKAEAIFLAHLALLLPSTYNFADLPNTSSQAYQGDVITQVPPPITTFRPFTGKVTKNQVRVRVQPNLDSSIVREFAQGDMFIVVDQVDDFYAVQPPADTKAYVFRTYVLDNIVEGNKVNVRLEPDVDGAVIGQLNGGDRVNGIVSPLNNKWLEIAPPPSTRFYISKDYIEKIGDASLMTKMEKRRDEVNDLLKSTELASQTEMQKDFPDINLDAIYANYTKIVTNYSDFPQQVARARELTTKLQEDYLRKKIPYLEAKAKNGNLEMSEQVRLQQQKLAQLEQQLQKERASKGIVSGASTVNSTMTNKMSAWLPTEQKIYEEWAQHNNGTQDDFYVEQRQQATPITGIIDAYTRVIKNKPGDYVLLSQANQQPIAYIYSTMVNLQDRVGQEVTLQAVPRPNNNFAYPAYFIVSID